MPNRAALALLSFPPRALNPSELDLFREWLSRAGEIALAYVSERRSDDPRFYRRIVVRIDRRREDVCTVHAPSTGTGSQWIVTFPNQPRDAELYESLRDALNSIWRVL